MRHPSVRGIAAGAVAGAGAGLAGAGAVVAADAGGAAAAAAVTGAARAHLCPRSSSGATVNAMHDERVVVGRAFRAMSGETADASSWVGSKTS